MHGRQLAVGLILGFLALCHPKVAEAQFQRFAPQQNGFRRQVPRTGSVSRASSTAYEREYDLGPIDFSRGVSNSRAVTKNNGGFRNGGVTSIADSNAISREVNLGGLDIGSTLTRTQTRTNGAVSRGVAHDLNVGNLGIETSLSRENLGRGFGLQRDADGSLRLGLGLLNFDLSRNAQQNNNVQTQAQVNAVGKNALSRANSNLHTQQQNFGGVGVKDTVSRSNAFGRTQHGQTHANTAGFGDGIGTQAGTNYFGGPFRRARSPAYSTISQYRSAAPHPIAPVRQRIRPKRRAQYIPFSYPQDNFGFETNRPRRQFGGRSRQPGGGFRQPGFGGGFQFPQQQNSNAQGVANNKGSLFEQQAGANTHSNNKFDQNGYLQDNGASSIGSNLANDGTSGQVSSANTAQMNSQTAGGSSSQNTAQSQSLNYDPNQQQATSSNAGTTHTKNENSERLESNSGSTVTNNNQFGTSTNTANTNSAIYQNENTKGSLSDASSQSTFQGLAGNNAGALTGSRTESITGPNGFVSNSASSNASASSQNGGNASASSSSSAGTGGNNAFTNAQANGGAGGFGGVQANSGAQGFGGGGFNRGGGFHRRAQQSRAQRHRVYASTRRPPFMTRQHLNETMGYNDQPIPHEATELVDLVAYNEVTTTQTVEQFDDIDDTQRQERTFGVITDLISGLFSSCVSPCTLEAFQGNRCCNYPLPPPVVCCQVQPYQPQLLPAYPLPPPPPPQRPPPLPLYVPRPPTGCCNICRYYDYYGLPPCIRYGGVGIYGGSVGGSFGGAIPGAGIGVTGNLGNSGVGVGGTFGNAAGSVTINAPYPPYFAKQWQIQRHHTYTSIARRTNVTYLNTNETDFDQHSPYEDVELIDLENYKNASSTETVIIEKSQRQLSAITDFISNLFLGCTNNCTLEAFQGNRCCNYRLPSPVVGCCRVQTYTTQVLSPYVAYQPQPLRVPQYVTRPTIGCCDSCSSYGYYGPPSCIGRGSIYGGGPGGAYSETGIGIGGYYGNTGIGVGGNFGSTGIGLNGNFGNTGIGGNFGSTGIGIGGNIGNGGIDINGNFGNMGIGVGRNLGNAAGGITANVPYPPYLG